MKVKLIKNAALCSAVVSAICLAAQASLAAGDKPAVRRDDPQSIHGCIYVASDAFNAPQMWKNFNVDETRRDFGYAKEIHVNALRIWASYEYWQMEPDKFKKSFDQMLETADQNGIRVLISLFENDGIAPTPENMWATDPAKAIDIQSPGLDIASPEHQELWEKPRGFIKWFMTNYGSDSRLLAIEVMNEPSLRSAKGGPTMPFAKSMFQTAKSMQGTVPLTMGSDKLDQVLQLIPLGLDVIEFHNNFPKSSEALETNIQEAIALGKKNNLPVWLTEWQRTRPSGPGWGKEVIPDDQRFSDYKSLAATVQKYPIGNFFWSLMIKRAYLASQRANGTVNGLFWPDGSVWSLADAQAIALDPSLNLKENQTFPPGYFAFLKPAQK